MWQFSLNSVRRSADIAGMNTYETRPEIENDEYGQFSVAAPPKGLNLSSLDRALWRASEGRADSQGVSPSDELRSEIRALDPPNPGHWPMLALAALMVAAACLSLLWPKLAPASGYWRFQGQYLPLLAFGFVAMVVLYNLYFLDQNRKVSRTREELVRQLIRNEASEMLAVIDPLTELFNHRYFDRVILREIARVERKGSPLVFVLVAVDNFKLTDTIYGRAAGDRLLIEVARLLENNLRPSDIPIRHAGDDFLVLLPETRLEDAHVVATRITQAVDEWNARNTGLNYRMAISYGLAMYTPGSDVNGVLDEAERQLFRQRAGKVARS